MLTWEQIVEKANAEEFPITKEINQIIDAIRSNPDGINVSIKPYLIKQVLDRCEELDLPAWYIGGSTVSVAGSYSQLVFRETRRRSYE